VHPLHQEIVKGCVLGGNLKNKADEIFDEFRVKLHASVGSEPS
jgi:hypothetical protein